MADEIKNNNDNLLIKTDQQNVLYLDPNSIIENGVVKQRLVDHESLVMYVNLEADIIPRSKVYLGGDKPNQKPAVVSLFKGNINFLKPKGKEAFDTSWTELYTDKLDGSQDSYYSSVSQNFGIRSIAIKQGYMTPPEVTIQFVDVRGKTLFESPDNSPYKAFFHLPYPVFYLTVKGFYGKAIRYQLILTNFTARFDSSTGNYEVTCKFIGPTSALLADIHIGAVMAAPYMYPQSIREAQLSKTVGPLTVEASFNERSTTKGFEIMKQVYDEYKAKGMIPQDFPYITLKDLAVKSANIDKLLEKQIFGEVINPEVLADMDAYEGHLKAMVDILESKRAMYLDSKDTLTGNPAYLAVKAVNNDKWDGVEKEFQTLIDNGTARLKENKAFGSDNKGKYETANGKKLKIQPDTIVVNFNSNYKIIEGGKLYISPQQILDQINAIRKVYAEQRNNIETLLTEQINEAVKNKENGIGFEPTIRNLFAVLMVGADTYLRLLEDVHQKAIEQAPERSKKIGDKLEGLYPFPTIIKPGTDNKPNVLVYPGDPSIAKSIGAEDYNLWPEVEFIENYFAAAAELEENLSKDGNTNIIFPNTDNKNLGYSETITWNPRQKPYQHKTPITVFYELYERSYVMALYSGLEMKHTLHKLGTIEGKNLVQAVKGVTSVEQKLKQSRNLITVKNQLKYLSPYLRWLNTTDEVFTTTYMRNIQETDFELTHFRTGDTINSAQFSDYESVYNEIRGYQPKITNKLYPFVDRKWFTRMEGKGSLSNLNDLDFSINQSLKVDFDYGLISNEPSEKLWYRGANPDNIFKDLRFTVSGKTMNMMNTPFFTNAMMKDLQLGNYHNAAHLFLTALPYNNLYNKLAGTDNYGFTSLNQVAATHKLPRLLVLKYGSMWNIYKRSKNTGVNPLAGIYTNSSIEDIFDNSRGYNFTLFINGKQTNLRSIDTTIGFYPYYYDLLYKSLQGVPFFNLTGTTASSWQTAIQSKINSGTLKFHKPNTSNVAFDYFTTYAQSGSTLMLFPSSADLVKTNFNSVRNYENMTTRTIWFDKTLEEINFSGLTYPTPYEHFRTASGDACAIGKEYLSNWDMLATFKPEILDAFEKEFLLFAGDKVTGDKTTFKAILLDLLTVDSSFGGIATKQEEKAKKLSKKLTDEYYNLRICNPKEIDVYTLRTFTEHYKNVHYQTFDAGQVSSGTTADLETIIGEDVGGVYKDFFKDFNIAYQKEYFHTFRMLSRWYAGMKKVNNTSPAAFVGIVSDYLHNNDVKLDEVLSAIFTETNKIVLDKVETTTKIVPEYNIKETLKLDLYNAFKKFNDQWIGGNILGEDSLMAEFLFLDRANRDVGQKAFINLFAFKNLLDKRNAQNSLLGFIGEILQDSGFLFYALPAYVNFYGITEIGDFSKPKYTTSDIASNLFGTFLEVDYTLSSPKFMCQYTGLASRYLNLNGISDDFRFRDDSFDISSTKNNPYMGQAEDQKNQQYDKSNRVVAFEVNFGDQAQGIFKSISLDQANIKNTSESYAIIEQMSNQNNNNNTAQVHSGLFNVYLNRNYTCDVVAMGNVMIQPGMYFYLRNVPMFEGTYLILSVDHKIEGGNIIETSFQGSRQSKDNLPDLRDVLVATNKVIYQKLIFRAKSYNK